MLWACCLFSYANHCPSLCLFVDEELRVVLRFAGERVLQCATFCASRRRGMQQYNATFEFAQGSPWEEQE